ncbi:MAG: patatin-like phospholipase family protein [Nocardioides sp.]
MTRTALVLGSGGVTGIAWELGILQGLAQAGLDLTSADTVIGSSAGAVVGAQVTGARPLDELFGTQLAPPDHEIGAEVARVTMARLVPPMVFPGRLDRRLRRIGRMSMRSHPPGGAERIEVIRSRIGVDGWPDRDLRITAVEAESGDFVAFDKDSGVDLVAAVAASCAVPLVWPAVTIDGRHYLDGGMRSTANVDLASGADAIVVLAPIPQAFSRSMSIRTQLAGTGARSSVVIAPDKQALADIGRRLLDPAKRADAARTGLRQAQDLVAEVRRVWPG